MCARASTTCRPSIRSRGGGVLYRGRVGKLQCNLLVLVFTTYEPVQRYSIYHHTHYKSASLLDPILAPMRNARLYGNLLRTYTLITTHRPPNR